MKNVLFRRMLSTLLALLLLLTVFSGLTAFAAAPQPTEIGKNTAKRHEVCTSLSDAAKAYYPAGSTYTDLIALPGVKTNDSTEAIGSPLFNKLQSMMQPKDTISYSALTSYWKYTDASEGSSDACLFYSDEISSSYNREHVWPKSRGNFYQSGAGSDIQHLRPTNSTINSTRGNMTMGNVKSKEGYTVKTKDYNGKTVLWYISNYTDNDCEGLVEIADNVKGDVARIYLYVYTTYGAQNANKNLFTKCGSYGASDNDGNKVIESLDTLLEWCALDPVDEWEMMRNDLCQKVQGNRNIFIDYPELGWYLFGREDEIPGDMPTPSGMASGMTPTSYTITAVSNNEAWGTVTLTGKIIDASPAEGYYAAGYEVLDGEATVSQNGNRFSVSPKSDCTVQINFAAKNVCCIYYHECGAVISIFSVYTGEAIPLPQISRAVEGWKAVGWVTDELDGEVTERPAYYEPLAPFTPTGDIHFYALYSKVDDASVGETDSYALCTELPAAVEGAYVLSSEDADYVLLCDGSETVSTTAASIAFANSGMTKKDDTLLDVTDRYTLICEHVSGDKYSFRLKGASTPLYLMTTDANGGFNVTEDRDNPEAQWTVSINSAGAVISNCAYTSRSIRFNSSSMMFRTYTSGQQPVYLWKSVEGGQVYYSTSPAEATPHVHDIAEAEAVEPTCTESGCIEHLYCTICGKCFSLEAYNETGELIEIPASAVVLPALGHDLVLTETIQPTCTTYGYSIYNCSRCDYYEFGNNVEALGHAWDEGVITVEPTEESEGEITYTCTRCGATQVDSLPALEPVDPCADGHDWGEPTYVWAEDNSTVTATRVCQTNPEHIETETVNTSSEETLAPTVEAEGEITYTAEFENTAFQTQTKVVAIPKLEPTDPCAEGHDWAEPVYEWDEDNSTVTATRVCKTNPEHVESEIANTTSEVTKEATEDEEGEITYTAEFRNPVFETQTKAVATPKLEPDDPENPTNTSFEDVPEGAYYAEPVAWAVAQGVTNGTGANKFSPDAKCTRGQVVTFLWRAKGSPDPSVRDGSSDVPFTDVKESGYFYTAVLWAVENGITTGTGGGKFSPNQGCTRGQVVTFLWRTEGKPEPAVGDGAFDIPFDDVKATDYYCKAVLWAVENGITTGTGNGKFSPNKGCTRGQIVTFLYRDLAGRSFRSVPMHYTQLTMEQATERLEPPEPVSFTDVPADAYYAEPVDWAVENGITNGMGNNKFMPNRTCSRGQVVTFLWRAKGSPVPEALQSVILGEAKNLSSETEDDSSSQAPQNDMRGANPFTDVQEGDYFYSAVLWAVENGITEGMGGGKFAPDSGCTRAQVVTFLWRAEGKPVVTPEKEAPVEMRYTRITMEKAKEMMARNDGHVIVDVRTESWYKKGHIPGAINIPNSTIVAGTMPKELPDLNQIILVYCSRGGRAVIASEKLTKTGYKHVYAIGGIDDWDGEIVVGSEPGGDYHDCQFTDVKKSDYFFDAVLWAVETGITNGMGNNKFMPNMACTRGQIVTFLYRDLAKKAERCETPLLD